MDDATRNKIADCLENLAEEQTWNPSTWKQRYDLVSANWKEDELLKYVQHDIIHYEGVFHSRNILGFRVQANRYQLEHYRQIFRDVAAYLRARISLTDAKKKYDL